MKIERESNSRCVRFDMIEVGECFTSNLGHVYVLFRDLSGRGVVDYAGDLESGGTVHFKPDTFVLRHPNAKVVVP